MKRDLKAEEEFLIRKFKMSGNFDHLEQLTQLVAQQPGVSQEAIEHARKLLSLARADYEAERK